MQNRETKPMDLKAVRVTDKFWAREMETIRSRVIPYQWEALNDRVPGAEPSWWMHNLRAAARAVAAKKAGGVYVPRQKVQGMTALPNDPAGADRDFFYGWVFQDSDGYKWVEAASYQLALRPDDTLRAHVQEAVDAICAAQEEDGYLNSFYTLVGRDKSFTNLKDHHELYCFGHLTEAAIAWRQATGQDDLLNAVRRYGDYIRSQFGPGKRRGCPGHEIAEMALLRLYEETGEKKWLDLALFFLDVRGTYPSTFAEEDNVRRRAEGKEALSLDPQRYTYYQAHMPVRDMREAVGHAVRQMYLCSGMADAARLTGDKAMDEACESLWQSTVNEKLYVTGGVGGTHVGEAFSRPFDLPADTAYSETCAAVGLAFFARRMLQMRPEARYAAVMERALYNTVLSGMALDGESFFYVNPLEVDPDACDSDQRLSHVKPVRQKWFSCACCPPNLARLVSSLGSYIATRAEDALYIHLYVGSEIETTLNGESVTLRLDADWKKGEVKLTVTSGKAKGKLALRIADWMQGAAYSYSGEKEVREENGYAVFSGGWQPGDRIALRFQVLPRAISASPQVREAAGQVCFSYGPFVYCAEEADNGKGLHLLRACPERAGEAAVREIEIGGVALPAVIVPGKRVRIPEGAPLYQPWRKEETEDTMITLIPYFAWSNRGRGEMRVWLRT